MKKNFQVQPNSTWLQSGCCITFSFLVHGQSWFGIVFHSRHNLYPWAKWINFNPKAEWSLQVGPDFSRHTACMRPVTMCVINKLNLIWYMQVLLYMHKYRSWKIVVVHKNKLSFLTIFPEINYELLIEEDRPHHCYSLLLLLLVWTTHCIFEISIISLCSQQVCLHVCMWERESSVLQKLINMNCPKVKWHDMLLIGCRMNSENLTCVLKSTEIRSSFNHPLVVS